MLFEIFIKLFDGIVQLFGVLLAGFLIFLPLPLVGSGIVNEVVPLLLCGKQGLSGFFHGKALFFEREPRPAAPVRL